MSASDEALMYLNKPNVSKDAGEWTSFCWHGGHKYDHARFRTWRQALAYALQHVEDAHACVSTP